jgi:hypothetical protein
VDTEPVLLPRNSFLPSLFNALLIAEPIPVMFTHAD